MNSFIRPYGPHPHAQFSTVYKTSKPSLPLLPRCRVCPGQWGGRREVSLSSRLVLAFNPTSLKLPAAAALLSIHFIWLPRPRNPDWPLDPSGSMIKYSDQCPSEEKWTFPPMQIYIYSIKRIKGRNLKQNRYIKILTVYSQTSKALPTIETML